jgi:hypothetical protein
MELDDLSQSGIRRVADYSPYLDQLAGLANEMGLRQRSNLVHLEKCLNREWSLGQNSILSWCPLDDGILVLVVPHYAIAEYTATPSADPSMPQRVSARFITELISGDRQLTLTQMQKVADSTLRDQLRRQPGGNFVRHCRLQPADTVRANDSAQQPFVFTEFGTREDARAGCRHQLRSLFERRRFLHLESRQWHRCERQPVPLYAPGTGGQRNRT